MTKKIIRTLFSFILMEISLAFGQGRLYEGPTDPAGDQAAIREAHMSGNRFRQYFTNQGVQGHWGYLDASRFPANSEQGLELFDSNVMIVGARVYVEQDTIPVTNMNDILSRQPGTLDTLYYCLSGHTDHPIDMSPDGLVEWGFQPVFGYFNISGESPAMANSPQTWPPNGWPSQGLERKWPGLWNGRFGPFKYAEEESYFVMNDAQDQENLQSTLPARYYPRAASNIKIGDLNPELITTQLGMPWGGVGTRVAVRGYQWKNPQTQDIVFWEYDVTNISDYDLPEVVFGFLMDLGIGHFFGTGDGEDDVGSFNKELNLSFCWDLNGTGYSNYHVGTLGFAFLESPGIPDDGIDNDADGLTDEKRDNKASMIVDPMYGITNLDNFTTYFGVKQEDLRKHWDADEDQDWKDGEDLNGNGIYDSGEIAGDDVGLDGIMPGESNYTGPDADGTECNHKPDYMEGIGAEPNFAITDVGESDMLGLTSFQLFFHHYANPDRWVTHDKTCFLYLANHLLDASYDDPANLNQTFSSGPFPLFKGRTERISMANIATFENIAILNDEKIAPVQFERKKAVQVIYEADYRFARPPIMPKLTAIPGDGKVTLTWDSRSDRDTRESLMNGENDFEGYKLFKSTERSFSDAEKITNGLGVKSANMWIFQCDVKNNYFGFTDYAYVEGAGYFLGENTGIQHYFVDNEVENGRTYYYYLTAYDRGIVAMNIAPSENVATLIVDDAENITYITPNIAIATPRPPVNDFVPSGVEVQTNLEGLAGTGTVSLAVVEANNTKPDHVYKLTFLADTLTTRPRIPEELEYRNVGFRVYDVTDSNRMVYEENPQHFVRVNILSDTVKVSGISTVYYLSNIRPVVSDIFDGIQLTMNNLVKGCAWDSLNTGWVNGYGEMNLTINKSKMNTFPWQYDIVFTDENNKYTTTYPGIRLMDANGSLIRDKFFKDASFPFYVENKLFTDSTGYKKLDIVGVDKNGNGTFDLFEDYAVVGFWYKEATARWHTSLFQIDFNGFTEDQLPRPGDVYRVNCVRPFAPFDSVMFRVIPPGEGGKKLEEDLDKVKVVPNPYLITNSMEPAVRNNALNQRRRLMFTHVPAQCTIKIFTMSGYLVDTIEVNNAADNGIVHWDMLTREGLEIAAGVYLYHIKSNKTGKEKLDKFAVIK
jgi:hypothetical protein